MQREQTVNSSNKLPLPQWMYSVFCFETTVLPATYNKHDVSLALLISNNTNSIRHSYRGGGVGKFVDDPIISVMLSYN